MKDPVLEIVIGFALLLIFMCFMVGLSLGSINVRGI